MSLAASVMAFCSLWSLGTAVPNLSFQSFHPSSGHTEGLTPEKPEFLLHAVEHIAATRLAAHRLLSKVAEGWKSELRVKQLPHEDLLRV